MDSEKCILRYLKGTKSLGVIYHHGNQSRLEVFLEADGNMRMALVNQSVDLYPCVHKAASRGGRKNTQ